MNNIHPEAKIDATARIADYVYIEGGVVVGKNVRIKPFVFICEGVTIEDEVFIGPGVTFTNDKYPFLGSHWEMLETKVCRGASIGAGAVICPGVTIGERALVGAGSVVTRDVPEGFIVAGNPAKQVEIKINLGQP